MCAKSLQSCLTLCNPKEVAKSQSPLAPRSKDSPGKNPGVGCYALLQGNLPDPGVKPMSLMSPALSGRFFATSATSEAPFKEVIRVKSGHDLTLTSYGGGG